MKNVNNDTILITPSNIYSQSGEDGIIQQFLSLISDSHSLSKWCVEFGAWDGKFLSNTFNLIENFSYKGIYIEGSEKRFLDLKKNMETFEVICLNKYIGLDAHNSLDYILSNTPIPTDFDILSIDIDGCDFHILESIKKYRPKIIIVEYNPTIPNDVYFVQQADFSVNHGASALAIQKLAKSKDYTVVAMTETNLILLENKYIKHEWNIISDLSTLMPAKNEKIAIFFGYDGTVLCSANNIYFPWLGLSFSPKDLQIIPKHLRKYNKSFLQKILFGIYIIVIKPRSLNSIHFKKVLIWLFSK